MKFFKRLWHKIFTPKNKVAEVRQDLSEERMESIKLTGCSVSRVYGETVDITDETKGCNVFKARIQPYVKPKGEAMSEEEFARKYKVPPT